MENWSALFDQEKVARSVDLQGQRVEDHQDFQKVKEISSLVQGENTSAGLQRLLAKKASMKEKILMAFEDQASLFERPSKALSIPWPAAAAAAFVLVLSGLFSGFFFGQQTAFQEVARGNRVPRVVETSNEGLKGIQIDLPGDFTFSVHGEDQLMHLSHMQQNSFESFQP